VAADALRLADQRMYAEKNGSRAYPGRQSSDVLVQVLTERVPELGVHGDDVARLATAVGERMGLGARISSSSRTPLNCTTSARSRSPTRSSPSPLRSTRASGTTCANTP
jgi:hypothetical protein